MIPYQAGLGTVHTLGCLLQHYLSCMESFNILTVVKIKFLLRLVLSQSPSYQIDIARSSHLHTTKLSKILHTFA